MTKEDASALERDRRTVHASCKIGACEPFCGLEIDVENDKLVEIRPNKSHPLSEGYVCIKGMSLLEYQNSPDRLLVPKVRVDGAWKSVDWKSATNDIGTKLRKIADEHGPRAIATYWGNAADSLGITIANTFCHSFGSPNSYNVLSLEYTDRGAVAHELYGEENLILQPDVANAKFALLLGTNPLVTQGLTLLQRRPHVGNDLREAQAKGGTLVVVDPRRTQTARLADHHLQIRPGTDLYLLLAMIHVIISEELFDKDFVAQHTTGLEHWRRLAAKVPPERAAEITTIESGQIIEVARAFAAADGAYACSRVGVQTSCNSTLTEWAIATLVAITGNVDRSGGLYYNYGVIDTPGLIKKFTKRKNKSPSRIGEFPALFGGLPSAVLADEILTEGEGQIRALVVIAGNPAISFPNTPKIQQALKKLDLLVVVDIFLNDTATFADYVLPAATAFERESWNFLVDHFNQVPFAELNPKVVDPPGECRSEWDIFKGISRAAGVPFLNNPMFDKIARVVDGIGIGFSPSMLYRYLLRGKKPSFGTLRKNANGAYGPPFEYGHFFQSRIDTPDRRVHMAPAKFVAELESVLPAPLAPTNEYPFILISGARRAASFNSWTHNMPSLAEKLKGNWAMMNDQDAIRVGVASGTIVRIASASGEIEIEMRPSPDVAAGVVVVHQHWGHLPDSGMTTAKKYPGVNVNHLHSDETRDTFTGMPVYNGTLVRIEKSQ